MNTAALPLDGLSTFQNGTPTPRSHGATFCSGTLRARSHGAKSCIEALGTRSGGAVFGEMALGTGSDPLTFRDGTLGGQRPHAGFRRVAAIPCLEGGRGSLDNLCLLGARVWTRVPCGSRPRCATSRGAKTNSMTNIHYKTGNDLDLDQVIELYVASTLGARRPIHNRSVMKGMLESADLIVTAWDGAKLVGISRTLTDFAYVAYLADLAVHLDHQKQGIGKALVQETRSALPPTCSIVLLAAPLANEFYPRIGFTHHPRAWTLPPREAA